MALSPEQLARLPKHAQRYIAVLESNLEHERARLAVGPADSDTFAEPYASTPRPLGRGTSVSFKLGDHEFSTSVTVRGEGGSLHVHGSQAFAVLPKSTNVVEIVLVDHKGHRLDRLGRTTRQS